MRLFKRKLFKVYRVSEWEVILRDVQFSNNTLHDIIKTIKKALKEYKSDLKNGMD